MAQVFGGQSEYLINQDHKFRNISVVGILLLFVLAFFIFGIIFSFGSISIGFSLFILFIILIISKKINLNIGNSYKYHRGRKGEYEICEELAKLPEDYSVFQDIKIKKEGGNIDFVVIGPTGIFAIEVKSHKGKISHENEHLLINGKRFEKNILGQTLSQALNLREFLKQKTGKELFINSVLSFSSPYASMRFGLKPVTSNIYIVQKSFLRQLILKNNSSISDSEIENVKNELKSIVKMASGD
jgi:hypothetical protein